jgi:parallel beta-helix repeat protein
MNKKLAALCLILAMAVMPKSRVRAEPAGNTYYVATNGADANPGTESQPWRTIRKAAGTAVAGDTVYIRGGTYNERVSLQNSGIERQPVTPVVLSEGNKATFSSNLNNAQPGDFLYIYRSWRSNNGAFKITSVGRDYVLVEGSPFVDESSNVQASVATPIIFQNYPGETVTINPNRTGDALIFGAWDSQRGADYVIVAGINVTKSDGAGVIFLYSSHNVFRNGRVYQNDAPGFYLINESAYNIIEGNEIFDNGQNQPGEGVYIGKSPQDGGNDVSHYTHIIGNYFHDTWQGDGQAVDVKTNILGTVIEGNLMEDNTGVWGVVNVCGSESLIYDNIIRGSTADQEWSGNIYVAGSDNIIFNNLIYDSPKLDGIYMFAHSGNKIYNNTIYNTEMGIGFDGTGSGTEVVNNILSHNVSQMQYVSGATIDHNLFDGPSQVYGNNAIQADPQFVRPASGDYHLRDTSPSIDAGTDTGVAFDLDAAPRPQGAGYDIGAFEFPAEDVQPPPIPTPQLPPPTAPDLRRPADGVSTYKLGFQWNQADGAVEYQIQIDNDADFSSPEHEGNSPKDKYQLDSGLPFGDYFWHVRARDAAGNWSEWSAAWGFQYTILKKPSNNYSTTITGLKFIWQGVTGALEYQIQVDNDTDFSSPEVDATSLRNKYKPVDPFAIGTYHWRVRVRTEGGWEGWAPTRSFTIEP